MGACLLQHSTFLLEERGQDWMVQSTCGEDHREKKEGEVAFYNFTQRCKFIVLLYSLFSEKS
jgi:hypothetical protein